MVSQVRRAVHARYDVLGIDRVLALDEPNPLVHPPWANLRLEAQVETASALRGLQGSKLPAGVRGLSMNRMPLSSKRRGIAAKGEAKEIAAQGLEDGWHGRISPFFGPRGHRIGLELPAFAIKGDGA